MSALYLLLMLICVSCQQTLRQTNVVVISYNDYPFKKLRSQEWCRGLTKARCCHENSCWFAQHRTHWE